MRCLPWVLVCMLAIANDTAIHAQYSKGGVPLSGPTTGGMSSASPYGSAPIAIMITPYSPFGGPPVAWVQTAQGRFVMPFNPYYPLYIPSGTGNSGMSTGGYVSGNSGSYSSNFNQRYVNPAPVYAPAPVPQEAPRRAFDRWAAQMDQPGRPNEGVKKQEDLTRALTAPTAGEISSGAALNTILDGLKSHVEKIKKAPPTPLDENQLKHLNFTKGTGTSSAMLKNGKVAWPASLTKLKPEETSEKVRQQIETGFQEMYKQATQGVSPDGDTAKDLFKQIDFLSGMLSDQAQSLSFSANVEAKRHLKNLEESVRFLQQADAVLLIPANLGKFKSAQELATALLEKNVRFAPASAGHEGAYTALHQILAGLYGQVGPMGGELRK
ncbi:MAG: hypothetical protein K8T89_05985 [Planctomycetes bacterium]|nr:hypothetical protein [Planctomycetota bacterium]